MTESGAQEAAPTILVAEDDDAFRSLVTSRLRADGYEVVEAADGAELVGLLTSAADVGNAAAPTFALVLTDVRMPGPSGLEALEAWRESSRSTRVVVMSAFADAYAREQAELLGATILSKPFGLEHLRSLVSRLIGREVPN